MTHDVVVRGGRVLDGLGGPPVPADVAFRGGLVVEVGGDVGPGHREVEVDGRIVAPGFVDSHTHSDAVPQLGPEHADLRLGSVRQGVTTEICGNCGFSLFPVPERRRAEVGRHLAAVFGPGVATYPDFDAMAADYGRRPMATNLASLVGQGTLRAAVVGFDHRPATGEERRRMARLATQALDRGAVGLSTGLLYPPGSYADVDELVAVAGGLGRRGRPYVSHVRDEMDGVREAVTEALHIAAAVGAPAHISHLKAAGPASHGRMPELLRLLDAAGAAGVTATADVYPYTAGSTVLHALLPPWATEGGVGAMCRRLSDDAVLEELRRNPGRRSPGWQNLLAGIRWDDVRVASAPGHDDLEGVSIAAVAHGWRTDPVAAVARLLAATDATVTIVFETAHSDDVRRALAWPRSTVGSDGIPTPGKPHPRWAGSFARTLRLARDEGLLPLPEAVRKMTSLAADRFGLAGRGRLVEGAVADVVVFDPDRVADGATYEEPLAPPVGVDHVFVGGEEVVAGGEDTGARPGRFLRWGSRAGAPTEP